MLRAVPLLLPLVGDELRRGRTVPRHARAVARRLAPPLEVFPVEVESTGDAGHRRRRISTSLQASLGTFTVACYSTILVSAKRPMPACPRYVIRQDLDDKHAEQRSV